MACVTLFQEFRDVFAWSYSKMPELDPTIIEHHIDTWSDAIPIHKNQWPIHPGQPLE